LLSRWPNIRLRSFRARNYRSLRDVTITPRQLTLVVGANGSGKTNLADSIDFAGEVYRNGLELAIARKGGYENIAHRKKRRTRSSVGLIISAELNARDLSVPPRYGEILARVRVRHRFSFRAENESIRSDYRVDDEAVEVFSTESGRWTLEAFFERQGDRFIRRMSRAPERPRRPVTPMEYLLAGILTNEFLEQGETEIAPSELGLNLLSQFVPILGRFRRALSGLRVYQINPLNSRAYAPPTPAPVLGRFGDNLPAVVLDMQRRTPETWSHIMESMQSIIPNLTGVEVRNTPSRSMSLTFLESGVGTAWTAEDISDGTLQTLATLVAIYEPRVSLVALEEPENAVHPWILRNILDACREASSAKQVILTSHSPVVIERFEAKDVNVMWREGGESRLAPLLRLDTGSRDKWKRGDLNTFTIIDSGLISQAVPPIPEFTLPFDDD
jgi:predicted ATPase